MKTKISFLIVVLLTSLLSLFSQEKAPKQTKEQKNAAKESQVKALVDSMEFVFIGTTAMPTGYKTVNLASNPNFLKFQPEMIESQMPFYGKGYSTSGYGTDAGVKFRGKPDEFTVNAGKKKGWDVRAAVSDQGDRYTIMLSVSPSGSASLSISSNKRSTISYNGEIFPIEN